MKCLMFFSCGQIDIDIDRGIDEKKSYIFRNSPNLGSKGALPDNINLTFPPKRAFVFENNILSHRGVACPNIKKPEERRRGKETD